ncbi:MAG TPA: 2-hydroxychromene-2-carboxylate isomerase [Kofleriaceae bacterium]
MTLEFWFDFSCPYAYLASRQAAAWAAKGIDIDWRPMLLGGVFRGIASGPNGDGPMAALGPAKALHNLRDMQRWAEVLGAPFQMPAAHPMRTVRALRVLLTLPRREWPAAIAALYAAYWERAEDVARDDVIAAALTGAGIEVGDAFARAESDAIKDELRARTDEAIELGIFGAPAWVMRRGDSHTLVWGQDRLPWVEAMLAGWDPDRDAAPPGGPRTAGEHLAIAPPGSTLDVYFDVSSPFGYLALAQLPSIAKATGVTPRLIPILLGGLFKDIGQATAPLLAMPASKQRYFYLETARWARWWGQPFDFPRKFPQRSIAAQRLSVIAVAERPFADQCRLATALARAMWAEQRDLEEPETLRAILAAEGFPTEWIERTSEPAIKAALIANTALAKNANAFGVPSFVVNGRLLFWGQDRLDLVGRALAGWSPQNEAT